MARLLKGFAISLYALAALVGIAFGQGIEQGSGEYWFLVGVVMGIAFVASLLSDYAWRRL